MLQRRLECCEYDGFRKDTLMKRNALLREYSKPLLDTAKRKEFEKLFNSPEFISDESHFLIADDGYEIAALLLLLEAGQPEDCLDLAEEYIDRLKNSEVDSENIIDAYRIIAYASFNWSRALKSKRLYEDSAGILIRGLEMLSDISDVDDLKKTLQHELKLITPFRILDLLSRNTNEIQRNRGIELLIRLVQERGGLENKSSSYMEDLEFQAFFRQIRGFLTLQEQLDLYRRWTSNGSEAAMFMLGIAMVACGFARRKPERLVEALKIMEQLKCKDLADIKSYICLLLGKVDANNTPKNDPDISIGDQFPVSLESTLATLCVNCQTWLELDVLDGYRDLDANADLEAYFSDIDVTRFIEEHDKEFNQISSLRLDSTDFIDFDKGLHRRGKNPRNIDKKTQNATTQYRENVHHILSRIYTVKWLFGRKRLITCTLLTLFCLCSALLLRAYLANNKHHTDLKGTELILRKKNDPIIAKRYGLVNIPEKTAGMGANSLNLEIDLSKVISNWLVIKSKTLAGGEIPNFAYKYVSSEALERLRQERKEDKVRGQRQLISASLLSLAILNQEGDNVEVIAHISYNDQRLNQENNIIEKTPQHTFARKYILIKNGSHWQLQ
jgi:hypothetical protein